MIASLVHCYVGCNSGSPDAQALHVLECDTETGSAKIVQSVKGFQGTTYFQLDDKSLYTVISEEVEGCNVGSVVRFNLDGWRIGGMQRLAKLPCEAPCHVSLTPDGKRVSFAAYRSATAGTVSVDGGELRTYIFPDDDMGCHPSRQKKAYAHFTFYAKHKNETLLGVVDLGCDRIRFFDPATMSVQKDLSIKADSGDGPRHAVWSKDGRFLFVVNELGNSVSSYAYDGTRFERVGKWSMLPEVCESKAAAIKLTADGKILMASNRGHDSIAFYDVDTMTGTLSLRNVSKLKGKFPRDFELMPGEKFMMVGHKLSDEIQVYAFDRKVCSLTPVGDAIKVWRPLCFKFKE